LLALTSFQCSDFRKNSPDRFPAVAIPRQNGEDVVGGERTVEQTFGIDIAYIDDVVTGKRGLAPPVQRA
jgi:hypothetical protein